MLLWPHSWIKFVSLYDFILSIKLYVFHALIVTYFVHYSLCSLCVFSMAFHIVKLIISAALLY